MPVINFNKKDKKYLKEHNKIKSTVVVKLNSKDPKNWILYEDLKVIIKNIYFVVPKGFETDFASVPRFLKPLVPYRYVYNPVVVVHDYLYTTHEVDRKTADEILRCGLKVLGNNTLASRFFATVFYIAVRLFGWSHWNK